MARYTSTRYWHWDAHPATPFIEQRQYEGTPGDPNGLLVSVANPFPAAGATLITHSEYDAILAADQAPKDLYEQLDEDMDTMYAAHVVNCETAYNDLIATGVPAATATFLTGHTP